MILLSAQFLASAETKKSWPEPGAPEVAFCGRSNVGKSSCLNALANQHGLARVSRTPGRTRLLNFFDFKISEKTRSGARGPTHELRLVDLPGYGYASGPKSEKAGWGSMIDTFLTERESLRALVILVDGDLGPQESDRAMVDFARTLPHQLIVVATKIDKHSKSRREGLLQKAASFLKLDRDQVLGFSSKEKLGVDELWHTLVKAVGTP
ncbi:MAG: YihA family ribosome biogenesis GTP-binding protein [Deltaproteobacteria bacterium]|nr:YihA family ribosome biogenesis GTP-binding protein [Deltaproteobacteria bacterium]